MDTDMNVYVKSFDPNYVKATIKRVQKGVRLLEKTNGLKWYKKIKIKSLDLGDGSHCILGQMFEKDLTPDMHENIVDGYGLGIRKLSKIAGEDGFDIWSSPNDQARNDFAIAHGFNVSDEARDAHDDDDGNNLNPYTLLGEIWIDQIRAAKKKYGR